MSTLELDVIRDTPEAMFGYFGRVLVSVYRVVDPNVGKWFREGIEYGVEKHRHGLGHLVVNEPGVTLMPPETRKEIMDVVETHRNLISGIVVNVPIHGFLGAALRAMVTGMQLIAPTARVPIKMTSTLTDASNALRPMMGAHTPELTTANVETAVRSLRARFAKHGVGLADRPL